ncbi:hypothetical protein [Agromyces cerinus]|uniref:WXG100 family type VII secretion target n=1 Tax=Agromyces cerinus subsp. cerinus TaxID=232089 RepID=A0A1N6G1I8_9MICO|nr:hypothetical protein [Agromyces cerinus]SIO01373.1 hypothetical protein SAMN05443544_2216 [Agromyces cerinus subsp. cerinus]
MDGLDQASLALGRLALEQQLMEARSVLYAVRELASVIADAAPSLPAARCTSWRSEASEAYATRLAELGTEVTRAQSCLDAAAPVIEATIRELEAVQDAAAARAAGMRTDDWHGAGRGAWVS